MKPMKVVPGISVGDFTIGMDINKALKLLQTTFLPEQPQVDVMYSTKDPLKYDMVLRVPTLGLQLRFDPGSQRLTMVEISNFEQVALEYQETQFCGSEVASEDSTSILKLYELFGPTYPGKYSPEFQLYVLKYRGVCFMFSIPEEFAQQYEQTDDLPLELPDGTSPTVSRLFVFNGFDVTKPQLPEFDSLREGVVRIVASKAKAQETVMYLHDRQHSINIGSTVEDVFTALGPPCAVYHKEDDKMQIHSPYAASQAESSAKLERKTNNKPTGVESEGQLDTIVPNSADCFVVTDYFYNYFEHGMDFLFDGTSHKVKKILLHSNFPGHADFSIYKKCDFSISFEDVCGPEASTKSSSPAIITGRSLWKEVEFLLGPGGKPMVRDSGTVANPFGASLLYAYDGCIFEVLKSGYIASVSLF